MMVDFRFGALMFHRLGRDGDLYTITPEVFGQIVDIAQDLGMILVNYDGTVDFRDSYRYLSITFDDGWDSDYNVAFPQLASRHIPGTFFISTGFVGREGYVDWPQLAEMSRSGMAIGSHTHSHPHLSHLRPSQAKEELRKSKNILEDKLGIAVQALSMPHGDFTNKIIRLAKDVGYQLVYTSTPGFHRSPPSIINRNVMHNRLTLNDVKTLLEFSWHSHTRLRLSYYMRRIARKALGVPAYKLWRQRMIGTVER